MIKGQFKMEAQGMLFLIPLAIVGAAVYAILVPNLALKSPVLAVGVAIVVACAIVMAIFLFLSSGARQDKRKD